MHLWNHHKLQSLLIDYKNISRAQRVGRQHLRLNNLRCSSCSSKCMLSVTKISMLEVSVTVFTFNSPRTAGKANKLWVSDFLRSKRMFWQPFYSLTLHPKIFLTRILNDVSLLGIEDAFKQALDRWFLFYKKQVWFVILIRTNFHLSEILVVFKAKLIESICSFVEAYLGRSQTPGMERFLRMVKS